MPPNLLLVLVALLGFVYHALSTDGGGTVLMYLGAPATWAIPKGLINPLILLTGLGVAIFQGVQHGLSWDDAATQGALAALVALGGAIGSQHTLGRDAEGHSLPITPPKLLVLIGAMALAVTVSACAAFQKAIPYLPTPDQIACAEVEADKGTPVLAIMTTCGFAQDAFEIVTHLVLGHTKAKAMRAAAALDGGAPRTLNFANDNDAGREAGK